MEDYGRLWKTMEDHGRPWKTMEDYGMLWTIIEEYVIRIMESFRRTAYSILRLMLVLDSKGYHNPVITIGCLYVRTIWGCESIMN
jgi:hypothetical protein